MAKKIKIKASPRIGIIMGSESDAKTMQAACEVLKQFKVPFEIQVVSAHRTPELMMQYAKSARARGLAVIIAGAGGAAHLPGMVASLTILPVIGVPIPIGPLQGNDALLSIVQMPRGVPVATVAIGNAENAALLALQILATAANSQDSREKRDESLSLQLEKHREAMQDKVRQMNARIQNLSAR